MEWLRLAASVLAGGAVIGFAMWVSWLYERIKDLSDQLQREHDARVDAQIDLATTRHEIGKAEAERRRVEWELTQTKTTVNRMGWSQKWN